MNSLRPLILITPSYSYYALLLLPGCYGRLLWTCLRISYPRLGLGCCFILFFIPIILNI
jgi:hypothetical protein